MADILAKEDYGCETKLERRRLLERGLEPSVAKRISKVVCGLQGGVKIGQMECRVGTAILAQERIWSRHAHPEPRSMSNAEEEQEGGEHPWGAWGAWNDYMTYKSLLAAVNTCNEADVQGHMRAIRPAYS